ncbi:MAG: DsbA family protein [Fimbriimonadaceae bacterium]|nr:DsbA family protein [Fimbriimonadaceae bacterium]QYK58543.1 MAG: DsbA family protein [Fimbriimonadaceae bacterium]
MSTTIVVAHDFTCPWCWIGWHQAERLRAEFEVKIEWAGYELMPENLPWPAPGPQIPSDPRRPITPSRLELAYAAEDLDRPHATRPKNMRTHNALEAVEHLKQEGFAHEFVGRMYRAYWTQGQEIDALDVIEELAAGLTEDWAAMRSAIESRKYADKIVPFDDDAYAAGVFNVPTFFIGEARLAEQPYRTIARAVARWLT